MGIKWSEEQRRVIESRDRNMLVSAAAGSGKTAVLVERIIKMITDPVKNTDLDRMLIVTFTKAAAAEMKERIREALEEFIKNDPGNEELRRQSVLIHNANISTIHSFCTSVIKNYFYHTDADPVFRVMDDGEGRLMKSDCMHEVLEEALEEGRKDILDLVLSYTRSKKISGFEKILLEIYEKIISEPWPEVWLENVKESSRPVDAAGLENDPFVKMSLKIAEEKLAGAKRLCEENAEIVASMREKFREVAAADLEAVEKAAAGKDYASVRNCLSNISINNNSVRKGKEDDEYSVNIIKENRSSVSDIIKDLRGNFFRDSLESISRDLLNVSGKIRALCDIILKFMERFSEKKRKNGLMDYNDLEHFALNILIERGKDGSCRRTEAAKEISSGFDQIITDEYQDSNAVQELILSSVSGNDDGVNNRFMVGDIKQSIYGFRHARPDIFIDKYEKYGEDPEDNEVIDLSANYRSRRQVIDTVNLYFEKLMSRETGGVDYNENQKLNYGADYDEGDPDDYASEILLLDKKDDGIEEPGNSLEMIENEASMIASRIKELRKDFRVWDRKERSFRPFRYSDCAILLRSGADYFETVPKVLQNNGIPAAAASRTGYFSTTEVGLILDYLRILDNPLQDIPFTAVLMSHTSGLSAQDMAEIRINRPDGRIYSACREYMETGGSEQIKEKLNRFFSVYVKMRDRAAYTPVSRLIKEIFEETGIRSYASAMPGGIQRAANLDMLKDKAADFEKTSFKGLFNFVRYIEELQKNEQDFGEAGLNSEDADAVRILTIHKSKGLEFPVVFVAGMGKQFNSNDLNKIILVHRQFGFGMDPVDYEAGKTKKSFFKAMIRRHMREEMISEELRVLYVAMTRAKEKLILTRTSKDLEKEIKTCLAEKGRWSGRPSREAVASAEGIGSWIMPVLSNYDCFENAAVWAGVGDEQFKNKCDFIKIRIYTVDSLIKSEAKTLKTVEENLRSIPVRNNAELFDKDVNDLLSEIEAFEYSHRAASFTPEKVSVSEIKRRELRDEEQDGYELQRIHGDEDEPVPSFIEVREKEISGALRGTAYHEFWKYLDYSMLPVPFIGHPELYDIFEKMLGQMVEHGHLEKAEAECIDISDMIAFLGTDLGQRMHAAYNRGELVREHAFVMSINACDANPEWDSAEQVLVQGIIDAYFYENGEIVLMDYKTDRVKDASELIKRYKLQLNMYKKALENNTGKKVKEIMIYSTALKKCVIL